MTAPVSAPAGSPDRDQQTALLIATTVPVTIEAFLLPYVRRYRLAGFTVDAAADGASQSPILAGEFDRIWNVPWKRHSWHPANLIGLWRFRRGLRGGRYAIVHLHTPVAAFFGRLAIASLGRLRPAVVYTAHGFHFTPTSKGLGPRLFRRLEGVCAPFTDALVVLTAEDYEQALAIGYPPDRVTILPGIGIDSAYFESTAVLPTDVDELRRHLGIASSSSVFVCIAEFAPRKRQVDLVRALALVREDAHVVFAGFGPTETSVRALAATLGVAGRTHFLGFVEDVRPLIRLATAVVLPSSREGLPRCLLEAMSLATPIIATDVRGSRELAGLAGLIVPLGDVAALASALDRLASDSEQCHSLGEAGRTAVLTTYDFARVAPSHDAIYARVLAMRALRQARS